MRPTSMICFDHSCPTSKIDTPSLFPFAAIPLISTMHKFDISGPMASHPFLLHFQRMETPKLFTFGCLLRLRLSLLRLTPVGSGPLSIWFFSSYDAPMSLDLTLPRSSSPVLVAKSNNNLGSTTKSLCSLSANRQNPRHWPSSFKSGNCQQRRRGTNNKRHQFSVAWATTENMIPTANLLRQL
ncbi:hypothetical protein MRB53_034524 [Persea americana]|uniref:Uncharacterized protein n=1 Tax=Persea americana TaxID=3435 RepID=A0ACC2K2J2_PERAE|nr:hypothetical protein MRB53_034524 [Persea americana]